jgi:4,5-DOPA dioxygenase extradiol
MNSKKMPVLFVGHGSPMYAIEDNIFTKNFRAISKNIEKPKAIICISAHWVTDGLKVTAMDKPKTIHDFYGFPEELYKIEYPAMGDWKLADKVRQILGFGDDILDMEWGLDHGTWSVLRHMYPKADVPVIQISLDQNMSATEHFLLAKKLLQLRSEGILIIGSGNIIHNLSEIDFENIEKNDYGYDWAEKVHKEINKIIMSGDYSRLLNYKKEDNDFKLAIPTPEHFLPLMYVLGLKDVDDRIDLWNDILVGGSLSMTSITIHA